MPGFPISMKVSHEARLVRLSNTPSKQMFRAKRGERNLIRGIRENIYISARDREFNPLVTRPLVDAFYQFMLDQILVHDISNAANERAYYPRVLREPLTQ